jgi:hypothetical protein
MTTVFKSLYLYSGGDLRVMRNLMMQEWGKCKNICPVLLPTSAFIKLNLMKVNLITFTQSGIRLVSLLTEVKLVTDEL